MDSNSSQSDKPNDPLETAQWTNYLPQTFGIRDAVKQSSYRWCVREGYAFLWRVLECDFFALTLERLRSSSLEECGVWQQLRQWVCKCKNSLETCYNAPWWIHSGGLTIFKNADTDLEWVHDQLLQDISFLEPSWQWCCLRTISAIDDESITKKL